MERKKIHFFLQQAEVWAETEKAGNCAGSKNIDINYLDNDIRSLFMAFYPGAEIVRKFERQELIKADVSAEIVMECRNAADTYLTVTLISKGIPHLSEKRVLNVFDKKEIKTSCKCLLYCAIKRLQGESLPWGTLTGIRPTKIVRTMLANGASEEEALRYMEDEMLCSDKKAKLSLEIAKRELALLENLDYEDGYSLYIGIPFCPTTCAYCSFTSYPISRFKNQVDKYLDALEQEIDYMAAVFAEKKLNTVYIGGGTPTTLSPDQLERLLSKIERSFDLQWMKEWTVEAGRPDSITREKLAVIHAHPVTRISINPQTMKQETLKIIGRRHTVEQVKEAFALAREVGFDNINMDIIVGLPDETPEDVENTLKEIALLAPDSLTVHSLAIKRAARLNTEREQFAQNISINTTKLMQLTEEYARRMGLVPYYLYRQKNMTGNLENVGYASEGKEGIYNILIMEEVQTIAALGAGAITKVVANDRIERCENVKDIKLYLEKIQEMIERKQKLFSQMEVIDIG